MSELIKILKETELLFRRYGIRSVTMSDIARELGMSKKTLYKYIENKEDLVSKIVEGHITKNKAVCNSINESAENALDEMLKVTRYVQGQMKELNSSLLFDLQKYYRAIWDKFEEFETTFVYSMIKRNLTRGIKEDLYRENLDTEIISRLYINFLPIIFNVDAFKDKPYSAERIHLEFIRYHIHGIVSQKGRKQLNYYIELYTKSGEQAL